MSSQVAGIILAAGKGTRMKSDKPKCLHEVCGEPMAGLVARAMRQGGVERIVVVVGHGGQDLVEALGDRYEYAWQRQQMGTGHAAMMASELLSGHAQTVVVSAGDTPLLSELVIRDLIDAHCRSGAKATVATAKLPDPSGYGRIVRRENGSFAKIVEQRDASPTELAVDEVNSGLYAFNAVDLFRLLPTLATDNDQGEYYLTDVLAKLAAEGANVVAHVFDDPTFLLGVNDRWQLAEAEGLLRKRILKGHALNGVTIVDPASTYVGVDVEIGVDTVLEPQTILVGKTTVGSRCRIGPCTKLKHCAIGDDCNIYFSHLAEATLEPSVKVGPYANIRPGTVLGERVKIGNFVEVKNARMGAGAAANHLAYIGDAEVGAKTNIGAGTITCNYDGFNKHRTTIGEGVFIGSNSTLVAPVSIADGAFVAAGSTITRDVPGDALAFGRARQEVKNGWAVQWRSRNKK